MHPSPALPTVWRGADSPTGPSRSSRSSASGSSTHLTIVARAFLGSDPMTVLSNKLFTLVAGIIVTGLVYAAIVLLGGKGSVRKQAIVAALASFAGGWAMAGVLIGAEGMMRESKEQHRIQAREGFVIIEQGHTVRIERTANEPLVLTLPRVQELDPYKRFRYAADAAVIWFFFFAAWSAFYLATKRTGRGFGRSSAGQPKPRAPRRRPRSVPCATRSIRISCSTRSTRCRRWSWQAAPRKRRT